MTLQEAEEVSIIFSCIKAYKAMPERLSKLHKDGKHEDLLKQAIDMANRLVPLYEAQLRQYPKNKK